MSVLAVEPFPGSDLGFEISNLCPQLVVGVL